MHMPAAQLIRSRSTLFVIVGRGALWCSSLSSGVHAGSMRCFCNFMFPSRALPVDVQFLPGPVDQRLRCARRTSAGRTPPFAWCRSTYLQTADNLCAGRRRLLNLVRSIRVFWKESSAKDTACMECYRQRPGDTWTLERAKEISPIDMTP